MARLAQTAGLTEIQQDILDTVKAFVDKEIIPHANALEHADAYPTDIVDGMKEMGLFGLTIPEEYGGLGESLLTYALVVEQIARGWMSVSGVINTHFIVAYMLAQHGTDEQKQRYLPEMAAGDVRGATCGMPGKVITSIGMPSCSSCGRMRAASPTTWRSSTAGRRSCSRPKSSPRPRLRWRTPQVSTWCSPEPAVITRRCSRMRRGRCCGTLMSAGSSRSTTRQEPPGGPKG